MTTSELRGEKRRLLSMFESVILAFEAIRGVAEALFANQADLVARAIDECLSQYRDAPEGRHPETLIYGASGERLRRCGLYGAQLDLKEHQVMRANDSIVKAAASVGVAPFRPAFLKWVNIINNFLSSLASATGVGEALAELKDCLRDELPDESD